MSKAIKIQSMEVQFKKYTRTPVLWEDYYTYTDKESEEHILDTFDKAYHFFFEHSCIDVQIGTKPFSGKRYILFCSPYEKRIKLTEGKNFETITCIIRYETTKTRFTMQDLLTQLSTKDFEEWFSDNPQLKTINNLYKATKEVQSMKYQEAIDIIDGIINELFMMGVLYDEEEAKLTEAWYSIIAYVNALEQIKN